MTVTTQFQFRQKVTASGFSKALSERVDEYFARRGISKRANAHMVTKTLLGVMLWFASYVWLMTGHFSPLELIAVYVLHGFTQLHMGLNIAHDANHGAYAKNARINRLLGRVFDLVGLSSYMWRLMHNDAHHVFVNVRGADTALVSGRIFRFSPGDERRPYHRYQHLYAPFLYSLSTLDWVLAKDYRWLFSQSRFGNRQVVRHPPGELVLLFAGKAFYYSYTLVLPLIYLSAPWYAILAGFVLMHLFLGFTLALTFQPNHFTGDSAFPEPDGSGHLPTNYIQHIFDTTADYSRRNPLAQWLIGGLNLHIAHHMFPGICHVHYPALTRIIKATAEEYGLVYRENKTVFSAFASHLRWMRLLGRSDPCVPAQQTDTAPQYRHFQFGEKVTTSSFSKTIAERVENYFSSRQLSKHANAEMVSKTVIGFTVWVGTYLWLVRGRFSTIEFIGAYVVHGFAQLYIAFNIAHDANHRAYSSSMRVNRALGFVFDLVGVSSYMWRLLHNDAHHSFVNIRGADTTLVSGHIFRFSPHDKRRRFHRYQHIYAPFVYSLSTLDWVLTKDYRWLFSERQFGNRTVSQHPLGELIALFAGKLFYYTYTLIIPLWYAPVPWYAIVGGFVVMHLFIGFTIALIFQPNHFVEESSYPEADDDGRISNNYIRHIFDTTADYAAGNPLAQWMLGGLNLHVVHHMFPGICHVHYPALTRIIKATAREYGLEYREYRTIAGAFIAHLRWMKELGRADGDLAGHYAMAPGSR